jgi:hypothetical protein
VDSAVISPKAKRKQTIPAEANHRNNATFTAKQRISKRSFLTIEAVFSAWSVRNGYREVFNNRMNREVWGVVENFVENWSSSGDGSLM